jgi:hypothetical protein
MKSRWMVCVLALVLGCAEEEGTTGGGGSGGAAGSGGMAGSGGTGATGGDGGEGGSGGLVAIECSPPDEGGGEAPFGRLAVCGDVSEFPDATLVPDGYRFVEKGLGDTWFGDAINGPYELLVGVLDRGTGRQEVLVAALMQGDSGDWTCGDPLPDRPPCADVLIDEEAQSFTFENFTLRGGDGLSDIAVSGTLYWE